MILKFLGLVFFSCLIVIFTTTSLAKESSFVTIVNPVRGEDFWELNSQSIETAVLGQLEILKQYNLPATWLIRYDALKNHKILEVLTKHATDEKGLFLEITPSWAKDANIQYNKSESWHFAESALLTGYDRKDREKLIDSAFEKFKLAFGYYPKSAGAWWIDAYSLDYMQKKYGITAALIVSDQYSTDNYQIWGQYFSTPYYPSKTNALHPAENVDDKLPVVITQWAARDPLNAYGKGVEESTYSIQPNDYLDYHNLDINYFSKIVDIYTNNKFNEFGQITVGLENSYVWSKYRDEYRRQIEILAKKRSNNQFSIVTMETFADWYKYKFPSISKEHVIETSDLLGTNKKVIWFMNPYYRIGWFFNEEGSVIRDIRQYTGSEEELCYQKRCDEVNFAKLATRVLDEVTFGHKIILDKGDISNFSIVKKEDKLTLSYQNAGGRLRVLEFLPKDLSIDGKISSIDTTILEATKHQLNQKQESIKIEKGFPRWSISGAGFSILKFVLFLLIICLPPGFIMTKKLFKESFFQRVSFSIIFGLTFWTLLFYILSLLGVRQLGYIYFIVNLLLFSRVYKQLLKFRVNLKSRFNLIILCVILSGTIFQVIPTFQSGLRFPYGLGFWGPNTHDGIWHVSLINQLVKEVPPQNPIFASEVLKNYHYFYDLLVASTSYIFNISIFDLFFRFYPILCSILLGVGSFYLIKGLFLKSENNLQFKIASILGLYFVYFAGSFGWIVEFIKQRSFGGESAFWANQAISFNLNPPFALSLLIVIAIFQLLPKIQFRNTSLIILIILSGVLIAFKSYGGVLMLITLLVLSLIKRSMVIFVGFLFSSIISTLLFLANFSLSSKVMIFSPFWFIHSMIDSPDRVGWVRLSLAREEGMIKGNWFKFLSAEAVSLIIFVIGNLGTRLFVLFSVFKIKEIFRRIDYLMLFVFSFFSLSIPIFFIQAGNPWNTIQFIYYFLYISSIISAIVLSKIFINFNRKIMLPLVLLVILITPINSWATANGYLRYQPHGFIGNKELEALEFLKNQETGVVLTYPYDEKVKNRLSEPWPLLVYDSTAYVSALSQKNVYLEDEPQNQILLSDYKKRLVESSDFFNISNQMGRDFLENNYIRYIYLPKIFKINLDEKLLNVKNIFENEEVVVYKINN